MATRSSAQTKSELSLDVPSTYFKEVEVRELISPQRELELGKTIQDGRDAILTKSLEIMGQFTETTEACRRIGEWMEDSHKSPLAVEDRYGRS